MKDHLELLIDELKSTHLIIKILQEEIKLASNGSRNQDNLTSCAGYKSHDKLHPTTERNRGWKAIRRTRATAIMHKSYNHADTFPLSLNRYDSVCVHSDGDDTPVSAEESGMAKAKRIRKHKMDQKKRVLEKKQHKDIILGDSCARGCAGEVSHLLNNDFEVLEFVNPSLGMKYIVGPPHKSTRKTPLFRASLSTHT
jgi:hypothetical protein